MTINLDEKASKYFTWKELLYLPSWSCYHVPSEEEIVNLKQLAEKMDEIREYLDKPIHVNCAIRPQAANIPGNKMDGKDYNRLIGGAPASAHVKGLAMDFVVSSITTDDVRHLLEPKLEEFQVRMEKKPGSNWVHIDLMPPHPNRYFRP